jgi:hypothetical protein
MSEATKTYTPLMEIPKTHITKCSEMLGNSMQCWRAGDYQITVTTPAPTEDNPEAVETVTYQKCRRHAQAERNKDAQTLVTGETVEHEVELAKEAEKSTPPKTQPGSAVKK